MDLNITTEQAALVSTEDLSVPGAAALTIYSQQLASLDLLSADEERLLGGQIDAVVSSMLQTIIASPAGLGQLQNLIIDTLQPYINNDGTVSKRWKHQVTPQYLENVLLTLVDTLQVQHWLTDSGQDSIKLRQTLTVNLCSLIHNIGPGRDHLLALAEQKAFASQISSALSKEYYQLRQTLIEKNLRLVYTVAGRFRNTGILFEDLIQEGNLGLIKAVDRFNFSTGYRFSTYAFWCIQNVLKTALQKRYHTIARPSYLQEKLALIQRMRQLFIQQHERLPTLIELSELTQLPEAMLGKIEAFPQEPRSLDQPLGDDEQTLGMTIDDGINTCEQAYDARLKRKVLDRIAEVLSEREYLIMKMRFGIDCRTEHTLEEISHQLNISVERVRQLQKNALVKLQQRATY